MQQMAILQNLPYSLCESGPEQVDGIGNFSLQVLAPAPSQISVLTLYLLDSHGQIPSKTGKNDYDHIKQSQIDWFAKTSKAQRSARNKHASLVFQHIPLPEYDDKQLGLRNGHRREPPEGPSFNSHFYDTLVKEGVIAISCGHDHVNDFCALLPQQSQQNGNEYPRFGPWLCYGGGSGFGGYGSYGGKRFHRRMRVWELDSKTEALKTWKRVEYVMDRVDELMLMQNGVVVDTQVEDDEGN
jgi:hypothetical protein